MSTSLDEFLFREYDFSNYNCGHFVAEVWKVLTGECIADICKDFVMGDADAHAKNVRQRLKLRKPESPCVVLMQSPNSLPHAGIYVDGRILHLTEQGAQLQDLSILEIYNRLSFFK